MDEACAEPLRRITKYYPAFQGAVVCVDRHGNHSGAGYGWEFSYAVRVPDMPCAQVVSVPPLGP